jgi:hypothetical protein
VVEGRERTFFSRSKEKSRKKRVRGQCHFIQEEEIFFPQQSDFQDIIEADVLFFRPKNVEDVHRIGKFLPHICNVERRKRLAARFTKAWMMGFEISKYKII